MWGKVSCLRKQHDGRDWASNHRPSDLKSTTPPLPWLNLEKCFPDPTPEKTMRRNSGASYNCAYFAPDLDCEQSLCCRQIDCSRSLTPDPTDEIRIIFLKQERSYSMYAFSPKHIHFSFLIRTKTLTNADENGFFPNGFESGWSENASSFFFCEKANTDNSENADVIFYCLTMGNSRERKTSENNIMKLKLLQYERNHWTENV